MIVLHEADATTFESLGIKTLQPISAIVRKEDNGDYFLDLRDRADLYPTYLKDRIIAVDTVWGRQAFRIDEIKLRGSKVDIKAWHLFYDAKNYLIEDNYIVEQDANYALDYLNDNTDVTSPFTTISDVATSSSIRIVRNSLYEATLKIVERWGGHLDLDNWEIGLRDVVGQDRGVTVAYGKNITDFGIDERWGDVVTKLLPVGKDGLLLDAIYVEDGVADYDKPYSKVLSFNQDEILEDDYKDEEGVLDETAYTDALKADLLAQAELWLSTNHVPKVNYGVEAYLEGISDIGDVIRVEHPRLKTPLATNVLAINFDAIRERITKVEFGNFNPRLDNLVSDTVQMVENTVERSAVEVTTNFDRAIAEAQAQITAIMNNSYVVYEGDQILVVDSLPKETATNVMRINSQGIGFSTDGITGDFTSAWTIQGTLDMQAINVINLVADRIKGGTLRIGFYEGNSGLIELYDEFGNEVGQIDNNGIVLTNPNGDRLEISPTDGLSAYSSISGTEVEVFSIDRDVTDIAKLNARQQIQMTPIKIVPIPTGDQAGWAFVKLEEA